jgi:hypothetical protein
MLMLCFYFTAEFVKVNSKKDVRIIYMILLTLLWFATYFVSLVAIVSLKNVDI